MRCKFCDEASSAGDHACQVTEIVTDGFPSPCCTCIPGWSGDWPFQAPTAISQGQEGWDSLQPVARACSGISALPLRQLNLSVSVFRPKCWLTTHGAWGMTAHVIAKSFHLLNSDWPIQGKHEVLRLELCTVLLMDDSNYPCWLVLVPRRNDMKVHTRCMSPSGALSSCCLSSAGVGERQLTERSLLPTQEVLECE